MIVIVREITFLTESDAMRRTIDYNYPWADMTWPVHSLERLLYASEINVLIYSQTSIVWILKLWYFKLSCIPFPSNPCETNHFWFRYSHMLWSRTIQHYLSFGVPQPLFPSKFRVDKTYLSLPLTYNTFDQWLSFSLHVCACMDWAIACADIRLRWVYFDLIVKAD